MTLNALVLRKKARILDPLSEKKGSNMTVVVQCPIRGSQIFTFLPFQNPTWIISAFQLQEYISLLMRLDVNSIRV